MGGGRGGKGGGRGAGGRGGAHLLAPHVTIPHVARLAHPIPLDAQDGLLELLRLQRLHEVALGSGPHRRLRRAAPSEVAPAHKPGKRPAVLPLQRLDHGPGPRVVLLIKVNVAYFGTFLSCILVFVSADILAQLSEGLLARLAPRGSVQIKYGREVIPPQHERGGRLFDLLGGKKRTILGRLECGFGPRRGVRVPPAHLRRVALQGGLNEHRGAVGGRGPPRLIVRCRISPPWARPVAALALGVLAETDATFGRGADRR